MMSRRTISDPGHEEAEAEDERIERVEDDGSDTVDEEEETQNLSDDVVDADIERRNDFVGAFQSYVRTTDDGKHYEDTRDEMARELCKCSVEQVVLMQAADLAAIFSGCAGFANNDDASPLIIMPGHPVGVLLGQMRMSADGKARYEEIVQCLRMARFETDKTITSFLYPGEKPGKKGSRK